MKPPRIQPHRIAAWLAALVLPLPGQALEWVFEDLAARDAVETGWRMETVRNKWGPCGLQREPFFRRLHTSTHTEMALGLDNGYSRGADPFPCNRQSSRGYTGAVRFNLSDVTAPLIVSATLVVQPRASGQRWRPAGGAGANDCVIAAHRAIEHWDGGDFFNRPLIATVPIRRDSFTKRMLGSVRIVEFSSPVRLDVTQAVRSWMRGAANHGLVLRMEKPNGTYLAPNNDACTIFAQARLEMRVGRLVP